MSRLSSSIYRVFFPLWWIHYRYQSEYVNQISFETLLMSYNPCHWSSHFHHDYFPENPAHKRTPIRNTQPPGHNKRSSALSRKILSPTGFQCYPSYSKNFSKMSVYNTYPSLQLSSNYQSGKQRPMPSLLEVQNTHNVCANFTYFIYIKFYLKWIHLRIKPYQQWAHGFRNRLLFLMSYIRHCLSEQQ